jgi:hypothetical protein
MIQVTFQSQENSMPSKHKGGPAPVPPANRSPFGPQNTAASESVPVPDKGAPHSERDPKGRLGSYQTAGEHSVMQPGGKQGPNK